jgi:RecB family exonuclease
VIRKEGGPIMQKKGMRMSKSRMLSYETCPYKFYLDYIEFKDESRPEPKEGSPLKKGLDLHQVFEDYYTLPLAKTVKEPYEKSIYDILVQHPLVQKKQIEKHDPYHNNLHHKVKDYDHLQNIYNTHLENFAAYNVSRINEVGLENYIPQYREVSIYDPETHFLGILDRAEKREDGWYVLDYKTGNPGTLKKYLMELALYKYLFEVETGKEVYEVGIYFSANGKERTIQLSEKDVQDALNELDLVRENIKEKHFPRKRSYLCDCCCEQKEICELDIEL